MTAARARRRPGARHPLRHPRHPGDRRLRGRRRAVASRTRPTTPPGWPRCATTWSRRVHRASCPTPTLNGAPTGRPAARQRPPQLPRLRGRLAADAARRPRHRVLDRLGLLGRRAPAVARAARDGLRPTRQARSSLRFSLGHTTTQADVDALVEAIGPVVERAARRASGAADEGPRRHVRRRRLGRRRRARRRGRPRRHRHPPRAVAQPEVVPLRRPRLLHDRGQQRRAPRGRRDRHPVLRLGPLRALPRGRGRGLHGRVRRRAHPQPVPALQREDQVRGRARPGARRSASTRSRPATTRSCAPGRTG